MRIRAVAENLHHRGLAADERKVQRKLAGVPVGNGAHVPGVAFTARHGHVFAGLAVQGDGFVPHGGHLGYELEAGGFLQVVGRRVAEHRKRRVEDHVFGQLAAAGALAHRLGTHETEVSFGGVAHRALGVVGRTGDQAHEGNGGFVGDEVHRVLLALCVLQAINALEVHNIGPGALQAGGLECSVEVHEQMIAGGRFRGTAVEVHHRLVVAVHEVHLEALDAHFRVFSAGALHIFLEGPVAGPEDNAHTFAFGIIAEHRQVDFRNHLEEVGLFVHRPAFVQDYVFDAVARREIYVVLVCVVVNARFEIHSVDVPGVPPVPGHLAGLYPAEIRAGSRLAAQQPRQIAGEQVFVFLCHNHYPPGEALPCRRLGDVGLAALHQALEHIVAALFHLFRIRGEHGLKRGVAVFVGKVHSRVVQKVAFGDADLHAAGSVEGYGQEGEAAFFPLADVLPLVEVLKGGEELALEGVVAFLGVGDPRLGVFRKDEVGLLRNHFEGLSAGCRETVCRAFVVRTENHVVAFAAKGEFVVCLLHLRLAVDRRLQHPVHAAFQEFAHRDVLAERRAVVQSKGDGGGLQNGDSVPRNRPFKLPACGDFYREPARRGRNSV